MKKTLILFLILTVVLAGCAKEYPYALDDLGEYSEIIDNQLGINLYQLENKEVALVLGHDAEDERIYNVSILDANKEVVASYSCKAESELDALAFQQDLANIDKHFGGQEGFVKLDEQTRREIFDKVWKNYKRNDLVERVYLKEIIEEETVFASPEYFNGQDFRLHVYRTFMIPRSTIYISVQDGEYHFVSIMDGCW